MLLSVSAAHAQYAVTASWDRNSDSNTAGYRLYYGKASGDYQWSVDVGNQTTAPLNLSPGQYFFIVRGYNAAYQYGPPSSEVALTVGSNSSAGPTAWIRASRLSGNQFIVEWRTRRASTVTLNGASVSANGTRTVTISATTTFTVVARTASGQTASASTTMTASSPTSSASLIVLRDPG